MKVIGCGSYLPKKIIQNSYFENILDTSDEWITTRTGIKTRHIADDFELTSDLAIHASQDAINDANINSSLIDLIIVSTTTPDNTFPSTAAKLQKYLRTDNAPAFDIQAVCSGFIYGLEIVNSFIQQNKYKTILLVGAEKMSSILDWNDKKTCVLFGDGAGAVIIRHDNSNSGILDTKIHADGKLYDILLTNGGVSFNNKVGTIVMDGQSVFKYAVEKMINSILEITKANNMKVSDIDFFIPHQANIRIINSVAEKIGIQESKVVKTIDKYANCSAASIPIALNELKKSGKLQNGNIILFTSVGAGLTWGSAILRW